MKNRVLLLFLLLVTLQTSSYTARSQDLSSRLYDNYEKFREPTLTRRRFKQNIILPLIEKRKSLPQYEVQKVGESFESRSIQMLKTGSGKRKVLLWSQMHGDEPTATMACFDIFNFLEGKNDGLDDVRDAILAHTSLYFVPMLNPDGAERYQRRNAQDIDINRDALALQAPESRILKHLQNSLQPEFGFNLHDKNPRYSVGKTGKLATISFLATAFDEQRNINSVREKSMQVISVMNRALQKYIPEQVGKWNEDFEPRAFGDNIQKWGTTLILIESGGYPGDTEKQYIRKLNFLAILTGLYAIATDSFTIEGLSEYQALPENNRYIYDLLIKGVTANRNGTKYKTDLGINRNEINLSRATAFYYKSIIEEYGDLSIFSGTEELDGHDLKMEPGRVYATRFAKISEITETRAWELLKEGYTFVKVDDTSVSAGPTTLPLHVLVNKTSSTEAPALDDNATFILRRNDIVKYAVVNGFVFDMDAPYKNKGNGLVD
jgi:hypothetical protein